MTTGWANYFCLGPVSKACRAVERHARKRLRQWLCAKHKVPWPATKRFPEAALHDELGLVRLTIRTSSFPWERFVRSIKESCLERLILFGGCSLRTAVHKLVAHYHSERNHQGLDNRLIQPDPVLLANTGTVQRRERMGGMLNYYHRFAA